MSPAPLPWSRKIGYGAGDFGFNLFFSTASFYLLYYYTDVLGLPPATAGWVFAIALIVDAPFDPYIGYIASKTRSRWGKYRPYLAFGAIPLAISWAMMFFPVTLTGGALLLFAISTHIVFRMMMAVVGMPYLALSASMTRDSQERGVLASLRMVAATLCGLFVAFSTLKFVEAFGGSKEGFFVTAILYGSLASVAFLIVFFTARETDDADDAHQTSFGDMWRSVRTNRAFWIVTSAMLAIVFGSTMFSKTLPYYFKYALERPDLIGTGLALMTGAVALSIPLWTLLMRRTSKRIMWMTGATIGVSGYAVFTFLGDVPGGLYVALALIGVGAGGGYLGFWSMMPDTVEYGEWNSGVRSEGGVFGVVMLVQKIGFALAAALLGELLSAIGYQAGVSQSEQTLEQMKILMLGGGAAMATLGAIIISFYPIDRKFHANLLNEIEKRRASDSSLKSSRDTPKL